MDLKSNVFGQTLAIETVLSSLKYHLQKKNQPTRALVMSFHGAPGVGKNMISQLILKNLFKLGGKTEFVHFFRGSIDFPVKDNTFTYETKIQDVIKSKVKECNRAMFVFDEVDKIPPGTLDSLRPFLDYHAVHDGIDYRRTIFIFLSNLGSGAITQKSLDLWQSGITREEFKLSDFDKTLKNSIYKQEGGFQRSVLLRSFLIDIFVPFLPLEKKHIYECLETEVAKMGQVMSEELYTQVLDMLTFGPEPYSIYAINGCKLIGEKAGPLIERELYRKRRNSR